MNEQIIRSVPVLCIEILSPEDRMRRMVLRIEDYFAMGVAHVWIFDPEARFVRICSPGGVFAEERTGFIVLPDTSAFVNLDETFSYLDEAAQNAI